MDEFESGISYDLVARSRLDVRWYQFPKMTSQLDVPGIIWLATRGAESMGPYLNDLFAIGKYAEMKVYMHAYDELLDRGNWRLHKSFEKTPDGLDTEELWQVTLLKANIIARQHPDICFNLLARNSSGPREREDNCRPCPEKHPNGFVTDTRWFSVDHSTLPSMFTFDALLTLRLLHFLFAEWARIGRPSKVLDLGCGRGSMIERWLGHHPPSFLCIDKLPGLPEILGDDFLDMDLSKELHPRTFMFTRKCELLGGTNALNRYLEKADSKQIPRENAFKTLLNCCYSSSCLGFYLSPDSSDDEEDPGVQLVFQHMPYLDPNQFLQLKREGFSEDQKLFWATKADWALLLDVAQDVPNLQTLAANVDRLVTEGLIITSPSPVLAKMQRLLSKHSFFRDRQTESLLQPWTLLRGLRENQPLQVYRRGSRLVSPWAFPAPISCTLTLESEIYEGSCVRGITMGCSDAEHIWVSDSCHGNLGIQCFCFQKKLPKGELVSGTGDASEICRPCE